MSEHSLRVTNPAVLEFLKGGRDVHVAPTRARLKSVSDQIAQVKMSLQLLNRQVPDSMTSTTRMELRAQLLDVIDLANAVDVKICGDLLP